MTDDALQSAPLIDEVLKELALCRQRVAALEDSLTAHRAETMQAHRALKRAQTQARGKALAVETALILLLQVPEREDFETWVYQMSHLSNYPVLRRGRAHDAALQQLGEHAVALEEIRIYQGKSHTDAIDTLAQRLAVDRATARAARQKPVPGSSSTPAPSSSKGTNIVDFPKSRP